MTTATPEIREKQGLVTPIEPADLMNKDDLYAHIQTHHPQLTHGWDNVTSKTAKEKMLRRHDRDHEIRDYARQLPEVKQHGSWYTPNPQFEYADDNARKVIGFQDGPGVIHGVAGVVENYLHEHVTAEPTEAQRKILEDVANGVITRVLSPTERKALEKLVDNDFATLRSQLRQFAKEQEQERLEEVRASFADKVKGAEAEAKRIAKILKKAAEAAQKAVEDAKALGYTINVPSIMPLLDETTTKSNVKWLAEAEKKVTDEIKSYLDNALMTLERQRLSAQRTVLLAGVSNEGRALLSTIPSAQELMIEAQAAQTQKQIEG